MSHSYSSIFVRELLASMLHHGADKEALLLRSGLREVMLRNPMARIPAKIPEAMFAAAMELQAHPDWGLRVARYLSEHSQRLTTLILFTAPSIRAGLKRAEKFQHLNTTRGWFDLHDDETDPRVYMQLQMPGLENSGAGRHMIEATVGAISLYVARFAGEDAMPGYVSFRHAAAADLAIYEEFFPGKELRFGAEADELGYEREALDRHSPMAAYNKQIFNSVADRAQNIYEQLFGIGVTGVQDEVRAELKRQLGSEPESVSLESVAEALSVSSRSLQRKLSKEGFSFNDIADDERRCVFEELVHDGSISISALARRCGFRSRESLYRSAKRWYGVTPAEYRLRLNQSA